MVSKYKELSRADRFELQILARLTIEENGGGGETYLCNTLNISLSGALVETGSMIPIGSLLRYSFSVPGVNRTVDITGEVVRDERNSFAARKARPDGEAEPANARKLIKYGIMFLDMKDEDRLVIEGYLMLNKKSPVEAKRTEVLGRRPN